MNHTARPVPSRTGARVAAFVLGHVAALLLVVVAAVGLPVEVANAITSVILVYMVVASITGVAWVLYTARPRRMVLRHNRRTHRVEWTPNFGDE